eukprot:scaffold77674_cov45-Prasinocladus_malaysianus.AAC.1
MAWLDGGSRLVSVGTDYIIRLWDLPNPTQALRQGSSMQEVAPSLDIASHGRVINSVAASESRVATGTDSSDVGMYEFNFTELSSDVHQVQSLACAGDITVAGWTRQGSRAAAGVRGGGICFFSVGEAPQLVSEMVENSIMQVMRPMLVAIATPTI